jgi:hypothetical protein
MDRKAAVTQDNFPSPIREDHARACLAWDERRRDADRDRQRLSTARTACASEEREALFKAERAVVVPLGDGAALVGDLAAMIDWEGADRRDTLIAVSDASET